MTRTWKTMAGKKTKRRKTRKMAKVKKRKTWRTKTNERGSPSLGSFSSTGGGDHKRLILHNCYDHELFLTFITPYDHLRFIYCLFVSFYFFSLQFVLALSSLCLVRTY